MFGRWSLGLTLGATEDEVLDFLVTWRVEEMRELAAFN
jgi:hypothetical protein